MDRNQVSRNDPCPCGSGKKYKHCCKKKDDESRSPRPVPSITDLHGKPKDRFAYPVGTVALFGPDDETTTKIAAGVITSPTSEPFIRRWVASDVMMSTKIQREIREFFTEHGVKSVAASAGNIGCPHEEGKDFLEGTDCPFCPFWRGKQGSNSKL